MRLLCIEFREEYKVHNGVLCIEDCETCVKASPLASMFWTDKIIFSYFCRGTL